MKRLRDLFTTAAFIAAASAALMPATAQTRPARVPASAAPNVLFVLVDDMGFGDLSVMGNRKITTPNLDRLAHDGVLMTRFYDAAPICSASRAGFLTGRFPAEARFINYLDDRRHNADSGQADWLDPKLPTIAKVLKGQGYATAHIGKWHLGGGRDIADAPWPTAYGFDQSFTTFEGLGPRVLVSDEERGLAEQSDTLGQGPRFWELKSNLTELYCNMTVDYVAQHADTPWFVNLWLNDVHDPWAPDDFALEEVMGQGDSADDDRYLATVVKMDRTLGRLFRRLEQMGELENTLVVVTSDNGPSARQMYYHGDKTAPGSTNALRGRKGSLYEGGIRQPLILYWKGHTRAGYRDETSVGQGVDLLPTIAHAAGAAVPAGSDGIDLAPVMSGTPLASRPPLFWAFAKEGARSRPPQPALAHDRAPPFAVREGDWKLLAEEGGAKPQLYNLATDPTEAADVADSQPATRDRLLAMLKRWMAALPR